ncbi:hypothetical protein [Methylogaea oryzae]|uniref:hypothetical protein n=1 Tax=Methylogaea oryzae TaxID=1295382 RepID=UPI0012E0E651|nr:hypothetical protein [Methylogaea oryzae]
MNKSKFLLAAVACLLLAGCQQPDGAYAAVHQIVPDPVILHLGGASTWRKTGKTTCS